jgi:hypothetical protein
MMMRCMLAVTICLHVCVYVCLGEEALNEYLQTKAVTIEY